MVSDLAMTLQGHSRSICPTKRKPIGTFLFMFNSNQGPRNHHYPDISQCYYINIHWCNGSHQTLESRNLTNIINKSTTIWTNLAKLNIKSKLDCFLNNYVLSFWRRNENRFSGKKKLEKNWEKNAAPSGEQIKFYGSPGVSLCDFETIGQAVSEKIF